MDAKLFEQAKTILKNNDRGNFTVPAGDIYPHQWLWDSCFIAIGLRHIDIERAKKELESLVKSQWANGMLPNIIFSDGKTNKRQHNLYKSWLNPHAPNGITTSGLTQPPMLAEAVVKIGERLNDENRNEWYKKMYPYIVMYHQWLYTERDPNNHGLVSLLHPSESGQDNSPPWMLELKRNAWPMWLKIANKLKLTKVARIFRRDTKKVPPGQRMNDADSIAYWNLFRQLLSKSYDSKSILENPKLAVEDLGFNCILIRANEHLESIANSINKQLPNELQSKFKQAKESLGLLWDDEAGQYFSYSSVDGRLITEPTISTLLALYSNAIPKEKASKLLSLVKYKQTYNSNFPIPSVPLNSKYFHATRYWQGPTWINMNWLIIQGLNNYGFIKEAEDLKQKTIKLVKENGFNEYFSPNTGKPAGAKNFSWTAALTIDLIK